MALEALSASIDSGLEDIVTGEGPAEPVKKEIKLEPNPAAIAYEVEIVRGALNLLRKNPVLAEMFSPGELLELERQEAREHLARTADKVTLTSPRIVSTRSRYPRMIP